MFPVTFNSSRSNCIHKGERSHWVPGSHSHHCRVTAHTSPWTPCLLLRVLFVVGHTLHSVSWSGKEVPHHSWPYHSIHSPQGLILYLFASNFPQNLFHLSLNKFTPSNSVVYPPTSFSHITDLSKFQQESKPGTANKAQYSQRKAGDLIITFRCWCIQ